jgi:hypothetical protein
MPRPEELEAMLTAHVLIRVKPEGVEAFKAASLDSFAGWRDAVADPMAEPRGSVKYISLFPTDPGWRYPADG